MPTAISTSTSTRPPYFALVAGEASGDLLGAGLITALRERHPDACFVGIGGPRMIAAGLQAWYPAEKLSVMGLVEVLKHLPELLAIRHDVIRRVRELQPNCFIGIDAPDFNLGLEYKLKKVGICTVHYVSPSIWAWRAKRARQMGRNAHLVLCLFPMEPPIYARYGVNARFVGHPLADQFALEPNRAAARAALNLPDTVPTLALLPGSRLGEIQRLGKDFIAAARLCQKQLPTLRVIAPMANAACREMFSNLLSQENTTSTDINITAADSAAPITVLNGHAHEAMIAADAVLLASGTATLEAMLAKRPMVVGYRVATLTYRIITTLGLLKTEQYALPNILAGCALVPELMQNQCTAHNLAKALLPALLARNAPTVLIAEFTRLHRELKLEASQAAAAAIDELLQTSHRN